MATEPILDLATLLAPIAGADPAGVDMRLDDSPSSIYYTIKDARSAAREIEKAIANRPGGAADGGPTPDMEWRKIRTQAPKLIAEQGKDFEVAMWLTEALLRLGGFAGLRDGLALAAGLLQNFPEGVHPRPDEDGPVATVATVAGLAGVQSAGALIQPLRAVWLSDCLEPGPVAYWEYLIAIDQGRGTAQATDLSREDFEQSIRRSTPEFLRDLKDDLRGALEAVAALQVQLDARVGRDAPSCGNIRRELEAIRELIVNLVGETAEAPAAEPEVAPADSGTPVAAKPVPQAVAVDAINNREEAFRQLLKIAEYFRKAEPHSPVAMAIEDAVRRGRLSLTDLLAELIPNEEARRMFYLSAGIKPQ
ncbi:MAG: type VI secretion system protein TssA [Aliidongia sp.]